MFNWLRRFIEKRFTLNSIPQKWMMFFGGGPTASGQPVTPETAMRNVAVFACVKVLAESVASLPLPTYRRLPGGGKDQARQHPLWKLLHDQPNRWQTSLEFREMMMMHLLLRGNAVARILPGPLGPIGELIPIHPDRITIEQNANGNLLYTIQNPETGGSFVLTGDQVLHIRGMSSDGIVGISPIQALREAVGLGLATEQHGATLFGNGATPSGILSHPGALGDVAMENLKKTWKKNNSGENANSLEVLEEGMTFAPVGMTNEDSQFLLTRKFQAEEIARAYRVPAHLINILDHATFSNIEHQSLDFVVHSLRPWLVRWEQAILRDLIFEDDIFVEFTVDGLLRGDIQTRTEALSKQFLNGAINQDEWRALENRNPLDDELGKIHYVPLNLKEVGAPEPKTQPMPGFPIGDDGSSATETEEETEEEDVRTQPRVGADAPTGLLTEPLSDDTIRGVVAAIVEAEVKHLSKRINHARANRREFEDWVVGFFSGDHCIYIRRLCERHDLGDLMAKELTTAGANAIFDSKNIVKTLKEWDSLRTPVLYNAIRGGSK